MFIRSGTGGVDKRVDALAAAMSFGATLEDLSNIDFAYAPPFNGPIDNIATAANVLMNKIEGRLRYGYFYILPECAHLPKYIHRFYAIL